ncbi:MAG: hypothetical protein KY410_06745, partial [Proteobacteria bacterium]|nr:hypothetical protein [Pseudomonadota bacterium]
ELVHTPLYFAPEPRRVFADLGLEPIAQGYVAGRAAPLGAVGPEVVAAVFFNFNPALIAVGVPGAWEITTPEAVLAARAAAMVPGSDSGGSVTG